MKKSIILLLIAVTIIVNSNAQSVAINTDNSTPDPSAILDIKSTDKGLLIPRLTQIEKNDLASPAEGLLIYNISTQSFQYYNGFFWANIAHSGLITGTANKISRFTGPWGLAPGLMTDDLSGVALNKTNAVADASALFDITSTEKGILISRMTLAQRDAIASPANALLVFQTDNIPGFYYYNGSGWVGIQNSVNGWGTSGNTGTTPANNFLGTTDDQPLSFKLYNTNAGKWDHQKGNYFIGLNAGNAIGTGLLNIGIGSNALLNNNSGSGNTAVGHRAMNSNTSGAYNVGIGRDVLFANTGGSFNTATGDRALYSNTMGSWNTAFGFNSLFSNTTGENNTAIGGYALTKNTTGLGNTAMGFESLKENLTGKYNIAMGYGSLQSNTSGEHNTAIGFGALNTNSSGSYNVAVGDYALSENLSGEITAIGNQALYSNTYGVDNVAVGSGALYANNTGAENVAVGTGALNSNTTSNYNTATGTRSLFFNTTGAGNTAIGGNAMFNNKTGSNNTIIGFDSDLTTPGLTNASAFGYNTSVSQSNSMLFGNTSVTKWGFGVNPASGRAIQVGSGSTNGNGAYLSSTGTWTNVSDRNKKENFTNINGNELLDKIASLPITRWKYKGGDDYHIGPMAQDFYALFGLGIDDVSISTIDPAGIALAGIQELKKENDELKKQNEEIKQLYKKLMRRIEKLEHN